jgi:hypothetical protein
MKAAPDDHVERLSTNASMEVPYRWSSSVAGMLLQGEV